MLIHEHIRNSMWFGSWAKNEVRHEAKCNTTGVEDQTAPDQASNFAQLRRLAHHRYQLWKRQQRAQTPEAISQVIFRESVEPPATSEPVDIGNEDTRQDRVDVVGELRALQDTAEHHHEPSQVAEATSEKVELQVEEHQCEPPRTLDAAPEKFHTDSVEELQSRGQAQCHVDEPPATEESPLIVPTCNMHEKDLKPQVKSILSSAAFTDSPSFSAWIPCNKADEPRMTLSNVEFRGCEQSGLQLKSFCKMVNVAFIGCKFERTVFKQLSLSNVTFSHVNFTDSALYFLVLRNVTLTKSNFKNDLWRETQLENALVSKSSFESSKRSPRDYYLRAPATSSRTRQFTITSPRPPNNLNQNLGHAGAWDRDIHSCDAPSSNGILTRLAKHKDIMDRILQYCFPGSSVHMYEYPQGFKIPEETVALNMVYTTRSDTQTSYSGSLQHGLATALPSRNVPVRSLQELAAMALSSRNLPQRGIGSCAGLLLVNKRISKLASKHLYKRIFHLQCSAEGAREFLLEHPQKMKFAKQLVLYYHWSEDRLGLVTDINAWRRLLGTIRHQFSFIKHIRLHIGRSFWKRNDLALGTTGMLETCSDIDRPFVDVDKFAAPAQRWMDYGDKPAPWTGTHLQIHIEGASTQRETDFVRDLLAEIERQRVGRPLFVLSPDGEEIKYNHFRPFEDDW